MSQLAALVETSRRVADTASRLGKTEALAERIRALDPDEIDLGIAFLSGELPRGRKGIGYAALRAALPPTGAATPSLSLKEVDAAIAAVGETKGSGSAAARRGLLRDLLARATEAERDFLLRLMLGELRQGALEGVMLDAVARAAEVPVAALRRAAMAAGGLQAVATLAMTEGEPGLARCGIAVMQPILPMLAQPAEDVADAMSQLGTAALEWKLDGARVQVHKRGAEVRVYTRSLREVSQAVPEVIEAVRASAAGELILDGETIALAPDGRPLAFQETMRRFGRKLDVEALRASLPLSVYFFDCLRLDDRDLVAAPAAERFDALAGALPASLIVPRILTADVEAAEAFFAEALARGHEGIMAKSLQAPYEAGSRGASWLKVKRVQTLDLVVLAAEWGNGRRRGWLSNLHLGARDPATGGFVMLGKTFKGLTDEILAWQTRELLAREVTRDRHTVHVRPELVAEIAFDSFQASPRYTGGLALRFARLKGYRFDKGPENADTIDTVRALYAQQR